MNALGRHRLAHPPKREIVLGEKTVECECDARLHRPVLFDTLAGSHHVHACMGCATVTCSEQRGDDGRYTGESICVHFLIPLPDELMQWLSQWPRVKQHHHPAFWPMPAAWIRREHDYLPAQLRIASPDELERQETRIHDEQRDLSVRDRIARCGYPEGAPPADLPHQFAGFAFMWQAMQLTAQSETRQLIEYARSGSPIAAELLMQRGDAFELVYQALRSDDHSTQTAALAMLRAAPRLPPDFVQTIIELLDAVPMTPLKDVSDRIAQWHRVELLLLVVTERTLCSPEMVATLRALMRKVARHDSTVVDRVRTVLRQLETQATPTP